MNVLLMLIPLSLVLLVAAIWAFRWAVRKGQFENLDAAAIDILRDEDADQPPDPPPAVRTEDAASGAPRGPDHAD